MNTIKLMSIAGARPNFMKLAALAEAVAAHNGRCAAAQLPAITHIIVHTGQHYDQKMSDSFFKDLGIPEPDINLEVGSATHAAQTAEIMKRFEPVLLQETPDILLVVGDVNSTIACTLVASKIEYPAGLARRRPLIVHVEAGLRSGDRAMPEEVNRILTDALSDLLFVTEQSGIDNLRKEGVAEEKIRFVGNVMIDTLQRHLERARQSAILEQLGVNGSYGLVTLHRPSNVDAPETLAPLFQTLLRIAGKMRLIFPIHPRTRNKAKSFGLLASLEACPDIVLAEPQGYIDFLRLTSSAAIVITDSGGIQEETTYLGVPCVTLRENTERPATVTLGSNYLIGTRPEAILATVDRILAGQGKASTIPPLWDGQAGARIVEALAGQSL